MASVGEVAEGRLQSTELLLLKPMSRSHGLELAQDTEAHIKHMSTQSAQGPDM